MTTTIYLELELAPGDWRELAFEAEVQGYYEPADYEGGYLRDAGGWSIDSVDFDRIGVDTSTGELFSFNEAIDLVLEEALDEDKVLRALEAGAEDDRVDFEIARMEAQAA